MKHKYLQITVLALLVWLLVLLPALALPARAQGETCEIDLFDWEEEGNSLGWTVYDDFYGNSAVSFNTDHLEFFQTGNGSSGGSIASPTGINYTIQVGDVLTQDLQILGGEIAHIIILHTTDSDELTVFIYGNDTTAGVRVTRTFDLSSFAGETIDWIEIFNYDTQNGDRYLNLFKISITSEVCEPPGDLCSLVENANFSAETGWLLDGTAVITNGTLTLGPGDIAAQNLTLQPSRTYSAVISTTSVFSGSTPLNVVLGTDSETLTIDEAGRYTTTFTTPSNLAGPIEYSLESAAASGDVVLDFTCVYTAETGDLPDCIAPANGTFNTPQGWDWYRGSEWNSASKNAFLPYMTGDDGDKSLIAATSSYTLPALADGEYLLLSFDARSNNERAVLNSQIGTVEAGYEIFPNLYSFETDVSHLAGETVGLAFANTGTPPSEFAAEGNIYLDNVCIFVSDHPSDPPTDASGSGLSPIDFGWHYGCADVSAILAGLGINVFYLEEIYAEGVSIWDPANWVPWLAAALWVNSIKPQLCVIMAIFGWLVGLLQTTINIFLNYANWFRLVFISGSKWLDLWFDWLGSSLTNLSNAYGRFLASWAGWIGRNLAIWSDWIGKGLANAMNWIGQTLANLSEGLGSTLAEWSDWIGQTLADGWAWLVEFFTNLNGLRVLWNWLTESWNWLWEENLQPFLSAVWAWVSGVPGTIISLLIDFILAAWSLLKMMFMWLLENVISVGHVPITFYRAFDDGINADPYGLTSCAGQNFWCTFLAGVQLINQLIAHSTLYPIVIVGIILSTLWILWDNLTALFSIEIK